MNDIDRKIQEAMRREASASGQTDEPNLAEEVIAAFRGRRRWLTGFAVALNLGFLGVTIWAGIRFYQADSLAAQLQWAALGFVFFIMMSMVKLWFWLEVHNNRVLRELKRLELLLLVRRGS